MLPTPGNPRSAELDLDETIASSRVDVGGGGWPTVTSTELSFVITWM